LLLVCGFATPACFWTLVVGVLVGCGCGGFECGFGVFAKGGMFVLVLTVVVGVICGGVV